MNMAWEDGPHVWPPLLAEQRCEIWDSNNISEESGCLGCDAEL